MSNSAKQRQNLFFDKGFFSVFLYGISTVSFLFFSPEIIAGDWVYLKEENGVKIFKRATDSRFDAFKVSTLISRSLPEVRNVFLNIPGHTNWIANCKESRLLGGKVPDKFIHYYLIGAPWPVKDREMILETESFFDTQKRRVSILTRAVNDPNVPVKKDSYRITRSHIQWTLEEVSDNSTLVTYVNQTDPGGDVPSYLSNWSSAGAPTETILSLKRLLEK
ncbi:lipid-binding protein [Leptospira fletcheri]|uniref:Lipid-binding protein n=1 Tax=Leptospira fletcheri TaxID=2484981 RepID=A0A4R9GGR2_9LEPT|nr:lipid-binding protein [Leptospira fletcheri]